MEPAPAREPGRADRWLAGLLVALCVCFNLWGVHVGWESRNLPGGEFRQAQTALSAYWIKAEHNYALAYPTPVMGRPWSIPMEFPLYQWSAVGVSHLTGWGLTKAGRAVSIACFYAGLPAIFLLLGGWRISRTHRWLVLAVVLTCPFYIYYSRAFLIETMALAASLWFWAASDRLARERRLPWLAVAIVTGAVAGLVKITTFLLFLIPAAGSVALLLWTQRQGGWRLTLAWLAAAWTLPLLASAWWIRFADATKRLSPLGRDLTSENLRQFNLGTIASRLSAEKWQTKFSIAATELTWPPLLLVGLVVLLTGGRQRRRQALACVGCFAAALLLFPDLYTYHSYYYAANAVFLCIALGLSLVALAEKSYPPWMVAGVALLVTGGQAWRYCTTYLPSQGAITAGGDGLTRSLEFVTQAEDVVVVLGQDWNSMLPYYSRRRALMLRNDVAVDPARVVEALDALGETRIGALVIEGEPPGAASLVAEAVKRGMAPEPLYLWREARVYLPAERVAAFMIALAGHSFADVKFAPGVKLPMQNVAGVWARTADLPPWQRTQFRTMQPEPVRFFSTFGPALTLLEGHELFGAHPVTKLVFALPAGNHRLKTTLGMNPEAYRSDLPDAEASDGVELSLFSLGENDSGQLLATRHFDPRRNPEDRGWTCAWDVDFTLAAPGEVEVFVGPGSGGKDTRDWAMLGALTIQ